MDTLVLATVNENNTELQLTGRDSSISAKLGSGADLTAGLLVESDSIALGLELNSGSGESLLVQVGDISCCQCIKLMIRLDLVVRLFLYKYYLVISKVHLGTLY